jgi:hypothetical protein
MAVPVEVEIVSYQQKSSSAQTMLHVATEMKMKTKMTEMMNVAQ